MDKIKDEVSGSIEKSQQIIFKTRSNDVVKEQVSEFLKLTQLISVSDFDVGYLQILYETRIVIHELSEKECSMLCKHNFFETLINHFFESPQQIIDVLIELATRSALFKDSICNLKISFQIRDFLYNEPNESILVSLFELIGILAQDNPKFVRSLNDLKVFEKIWEAIDAFSTSCQFVESAIDVLLNIYSEKKDIFDQHYNFLKKLLFLEINGNKTLCALHAFFAGDGKERLRAEISDFIPLIFEALQIGEEPANFALSLIHSLVSLRFQCQEIVDAGLFNELLAAVENGSDRITVLKIVANICTWGPDFIDEMLSCGFEAAAIESLQNSSYEETHAAAYVLSSILWRGTLDQIYFVFKEDIINDIIDLIQESERLSFNVLDSLRRALDLERQNGFTELKNMIREESIETIVKKTGSSTNEESMAAKRILESLEIEN